MTLMRQLYTVGSLDRREPFVGTSDDFKNSKAEMYRPISRRPSPGRLIR